MNRKKRVLITSDFHCGHVVGLTPPPWQHKTTSNDRWNKFAIMQSQLWHVFKTELKKIQPIDILIVNGDAIDGSGVKSGGTELITTDLQIQAEMAEYAIKDINAAHVIMTYGTPYHTGETQDVENLIAKSVKADKIGGHEWVDVNGLIFDCKHHIGSSSVPHGRHSPVAKDYLWNILWHEKEEQPKADIIVRSHVHYFNYCGGEGWLGMTTPSLQGMGSKYGSRKCSGHVDFGFIHFDVEPNGNYVWQPHIARILEQKATAIKF